MRRLMLLLLAVGLAAGMLLWLCAPAPGVPDLGLLLVDGAEGVSVLGVQDGSLADEAGVLPGDVLLLCNGVSIATAAALEEQLAASDARTLRIRRSGVLLDLDLR